MLKEKYIQDFIRAGSIAREVRAFGKSLIKPGASYNLVREQIYQKIKELDGEPAFPPQMALDSVAAHYLPEPDEDIIFTNQVIKLDVGVCFQGAIGDCAVTVDLSGQHQHLIDAAEAALLAAEQSIHVGQRLGEVGKIIDTTISSYGLLPVKNLCGHGLGFYKVHTPPSVPNCDDRSQVLIQPGMTFAIEPFATNGRGYIQVEGDATIFSFVKAVPIQSKVTRYLIEKIKPYKGLPFAIHDLVGDKFTLEEIRKGVAELIHAKAIVGYPPLVEQPNSKVAQAENSVLVDNDGKVMITTRG